MAVSIEPQGICEDSLKYSVAYSAPRIFSTRSLSSRPPIQICEPFGSSTKWSVLSQRTRSAGKHSLSTFGMVSAQMLVLAWLNRKRKIACRLPGALIARWMMARTSRNVLPEREPPRSMMLRAGPASRRLASRCLGVRRAVTWPACETDQRGMRRWSRHRPTTCRCRPRPTSSHERAPEVHRR